MTNGDGVGGNPTFTVGSDIVDKTASTSYTAGAKQTVSQSATTAGFNLGTSSSDPSGPAQGDVWYNAGLVKVRDATNSKTIAYTDSNITGNAQTATALQGDPADCSASQYANAINASGTLTCSQLGYGQLSGVPSSFTPSAHNTSHQHGGSDEVATATPAANAIPKAGAGSTLASGWIPDLSSTYQPTDTDLSALAGLTTR